MHKLFAEATGVKFLVPLACLFIMQRETRILFSLEVLSSGLEAHCREKSVQIVGDRLIEAVKLTNVCAGRGCDCQESEDGP